MKMADATMSLATKGAGGCPPRMNAYSGGRFEALVVESDSMYALMPAMSAAMSLANSGPRGPNADSACVVIAVSSSSS